MNLHIKNAHVISLSDGLDDVRDILVKDGKIAEIGINLQTEETETIEAGGLCLCPGLVDLFALANQPAGQGEEDVQTLSQAAVRGGYTTMVVHSGIKTVQDAEQVRKQAVNAPCNVILTACAVDGNELINYSTLLLHGIRAVYEDGGIDNPLRMRDLMFRTRKHGLFLMTRCRDRRLYREGLIREGDYARLLEMPIIPASAEATVVARDIILSRESGAHVHLGHISTAESVRIIRIAKAEGANISCSTEPHYLALTSRELEGYNTLAKLDPPLGNPGDAAALAEGLADGTVDCIASGHVPVKRKEKYKSLVTAPCGASSLETSLAVVLTCLYHEGKASLPQLLDKMTAAPARLLGLDCGRIRVGDTADLTLFDPNAPWQCRGEDFASQSTATPFEGKMLKGKVAVTINGGRVLWEDRL